MTLTDTGPLVALTNRLDRNHQRSVTILPTLRPPLVTTWICFGEAMHLLQREGGHRAQAALWRYVTRGGLAFHVNTGDEIERMRELMEKYRDTPMDLADASLVAAAESLQQSQIFTLDSDFHVYRLQNGAAFEIVP
jgi:uncharacterized protein